MDTIVLREENVCLVVRVEYCFHSFHSRNTAAETLFEYVITSVL